MTLPKTMPKPGGRYLARLGDVIYPLEPQSIVVVLEANPELKVRLVGGTDWTREEDELLGWQVRRPGTADGGDWFAAVDVRGLEGPIEIWSVYSRGWMRYRAGDKAVVEAHTEPPASSGSKVRQVPAVSPLSSNSQEVIQVGSCGFTMIDVRPGTFRMGASDDHEDPYTNAKPRHQVQLSGYQIGQTQVTQGLYKEV